MQWKQVCNLSDKKYDSIIIYLIFERKALVLVWNLAKFCYLNLRADVFCEVSTLKYSSSA